jgi:hypothetical protein
MSMACANGQADKAKTNVKGINLNMAAVIL